MKNFYKTIGLGGLRILREKHLFQLQDIEEDAHLILTELAVRHGANPDNKKSQLGQDLFALYSLNWKKGGYFVEFGATNGIALSNTYLLEKDFGWRGLLAEPAQVWHEDLKKNRSANIDFDCVWKESGKTLPFSIVDDAAFSTLESFTNEDSHKRKRKAANLQFVNTVSLSDLLERHNAPQVIDYLSIDTEGSEFDILNAVDFSRYTFSVITCEHNFSEQRSSVYDLLKRNNYIRVFEGLSRWDDWYIHASIRG